jgi:K+-sensing histidine kinase KdpD
MHALALVKGHTASAEKLKAHITKMDKNLQQSVTNKEIAKHLHGQYRQAVSSRSTATTNDKKKLTKTKVITTENVIRLRKEREAADAKWALGNGRGSGRRHGK